MNAANLGGQLGSLGNFTSIITINLSNNKIGGNIPEDLPITLQQLYVLSILSAIHLVFEITHCMKWSVPLLLLQFPLC
jgi:hypothetical protein